MHLRSFHHQQHTIGYINAVVFSQSHWDAYDKSQLYNEGRFYLKGSLLNGYILHKIIGFLTEVALIFY